ncbi:hypothetical protein [Metabacillus arenae]|uniref:Uncharacterized protein n=1 Tax=Metabacillus arenae TaxID=2771434 RepID=A0A926RX51_9BACI|nr:hypothetical protein [Metabacillus arenae]MBD1380285.1 hypothetical protein [Metabacillus arenae]
MTNHYLKISKIAFIGSGVCLLICIITLIIFYPNLGSSQQWDLVLPFALSVIVLFFTGLYHFNNYKKTKGMADEKIQMKENEKERQFVLRKEPSHFLKLTAYNPNGILIYQITPTTPWIVDLLMPNNIRTFLPKKWVIGNNKNEVIGYIKNGAGIYSPLKIEDEHQKVIGLFKEEKFKLTLKGKVYSNSDEVLAEIITDAYLYDVCLQAAAGKELCRYREGWMPVEWTKWFKEANQHTLILNEKVTSREKLICLGLIHYFIYMKEG